MHTFQVQYTLQQANIHHQDSVTHSSTAAQLRNIQFSSSHTYLCFTTILVMVLAYHFLEITGSLALWICIYSRLRVVTVCFLVAHNVTLSSHVIIGSLVVRVSTGALNVTKLPSLLFALLSWSIWTEIQNGSWDTDSAILPWYSGHKRVQPEWLNSAQSSLWHFCLGR